MCVCGESSIFEPAIILVERGSSGGVAADENVTRREPVSIKPGKRQAGNDKLRSSYSFLHLLKKPFQGASSEVFSYPWRRDIGQLRSHVKRERGEEQEEITLWTGVEGNSSILMGMVPLSMG